MREAFGTYYWLKLGKKRRAVVMAVSDDDMNATEISKNTMKYGNRITLCNLSGTLKELIRAGILACTDDTMCRGRPYSLTPKGKAFRERLSASSYFTKQEQNSP